MKINHAIAAVILSVAGSQALAAQPDTMKEEKIGLGVGTVIGAIVGGPIGAGAGAIIGGGVMGKLVGLNHANQDLHQELASTQSEYARSKGDMRAEIAQLENALKRSERAREAMAAAPELPIQFRTASSDIEQHYQAELKEIARLLSKRPDVTVKLSGFADRRGGAEYNQKLSEARVQEVKRYLVNHGVSDNQIEAHAFGESRPVSDKESVEDYFFDRRVVMEFSPATEHPVAAR